MQRYLIPLFFWSILGVTFFASSLFFAHFRQTQAYTDSVVDAPSDARQNWRSAFDPRFPGSASYVALRAHDRLQAVTMRPEEIPAAYLERAEQRLHSAQFAWEQGDSQQAVTTLYKAHGYLHRAAHACKDFENLCESLAPRLTDVSTQLQTTTSAFKSDTSDDVTRNSLASLSQRFVW